MSAEFAQFARVGELNPDEVYDYFGDVLYLWIIPATEDNAYFSLRALLTDVKHKAIALHPPLEKLHQRLEGTIRQVENGKYDVDYDLDLATLEHLPRSKVARMLRELSALTHTVRQLISNRQGKHTGLSALVFWLEFSAQCAGGAFTAHRKNGNKGSLIQALDRLRHRLLAGPDLRHLADLIPTRHPVATYERTLAAARSHVDEERRRLESGQRGGKLIPAWRVSEDGYVVRVAKVPQNRK
jgi:hypothetical protein